MVYNPLWPSNLHLRDLDFKQFAYIFEKKEDDATRVAHDRAYAW